MVSAGDNNSFAVSFAVSISSLLLQRKRMLATMIVMTIAVVVDENKSNLNTAAYGVSCGTIGACLMTVLFNPGMGSNKTNFSKGPPGINKFLKNDKLNKVTHRVKNTN